jgi:hypothetical protein
MAHTGHCWPAWWNVCRAGQPACVESVQILCRASWLVWNLCRYCAEPASLCGICADSVQSQPACVESVQILYRADQPACVENVQILCRASQLVWNLCRRCAEPASLCGICADTGQSRPACVESVQILCSASQLVWNLYVKIGQLQAVAVPVILFYK